MPSFHRLAALAALLLAAPVAAEPLGASAKQYIATSDARLDYQRNSSGAAGMESVRTDYDFRIAGDYTIVPRVTLGGQLGFQGVIIDDDSDKAFFVGARAGYLVPLGDHTTWWPRLGVTFVNSSGLDQLQQSVTTRSFRLAVSAPFVFQPYSQVLVGIGPTYERDLTAKVGPDDEAPKTSAVGVHLLFGLWFY